MPTDCNVLGIRLSKSDYLIIRSRTKETIHSQDCCRLRNSRGRERRKEVNRDNGLFGMMKRHLSHGCKDQRSQKDKGKAEHAHVAGEANPLL